MQKIVIVLALLAFSALASTSVHVEEAKSLWPSWKLYYGKFYTHPEEAARFAIFVENYKRVVEFNAANEDLKLAMNKFADLTPSEFNDIYTGGYQKKNYLAAPRSDIDFSILQLPSSVDWRSKGAVNPVQDEGQCGACWAFSTVDALEGWYQINHGKLLSFSKQQVLDCDTNNDGCSGGDPVEALAYTAEHGIELALAYPYTAQAGTCKYKKAIAIKANANSTLVTPQNTDALKAALVAQPVSIAIKAAQEVFSMYSSGVLKGECLGDNIDHTALAVGYTTINGEEAFIVKNLWGTDWGVDGYVYISTNGSYNNGNGACGILTEPLVPTN